MAMFLDASPEPAGADLNWIGPAGRILAKNPAIRDNDDDDDDDDDDDNGNSLTYRR